MHKIHYSLEMWQERGEEREVLPAGRAYSPAAKLACSGVRRFVGRVGARAVRAAAVVVGEAPARRRARAPQPPGAASSAATNAIQQQRPSAQADGHVAMAARHRRSVMRVNKGMKNQGGEARRARLVCIQRSVGTPRFLLFRGSVAEMVA